MRIVAGEFKGRTLKSPTWEGLRPTSDRLRETLFNVLGPSIHDARVLDGYAGTGAIGIEALSRGAAHVTFVERDRRARQLIEANLALMAGLKVRATPAGRDVIIRTGFAGLEDREYDLIVLDPPYGKDAARDAIDAVRAIVTPRTRVVVEHAVRHAPPVEHAGLRLRRTVKAGDSALSFYDL